MGNFQYRDIPNFLFVLGPICGIIFLGAVWYHQLLETYFIMDDFLCASFSGEIYSGMRPHIDFTQAKTSWGFYPYAAIHAASGSSEFVLILSRHVSLAYALLSLAFVYLISKKIAVNDKAGLWAVFWTLSCSTFLEHSFSIRVDMLSTMLSLAAVYSYLFLSSRWRYILSGLILGVAFCVTQKSIYFIISFSFAHFASSKRNDLKRRFLEYLYWAASAGLVFVVYVLVMGAGGHYKTVIDQVLFSSTLMKVALSVEYPNMSQFYWQTFSRNFSFYTLGIGWLLVTLGRWKQIDRRKKFISVFAASLLLFVGMHKAPWPYTFLLIIPYLGIFIGYFSFCIGQAIRRSSMKLILLVPVVVVLASVCTFATQRGLDRLDATSARQMSVVRVAEGMLSEKDTYFDGIWMINSRRHATPDILQRADLLTVLDRWKEEKSRLLSQMIESKCKVVIYNYRLFALPDDFKNFVTKHYLPVFSNVFVSGYSTRAHRGHFSVIWPGKYALAIRGESERLIIDGREIGRSDRTIDLSAGEHHIDFSGNGEVVLMPADSLYYLEKNNARFDTPFFRLFEKPYTR